MVWTPLQKLGRAMSANLREGASSWEGCKYAILGLRPTATYDLATKAMIAILGGANNNGGTICPGEG